MILDNQFRVAIPPERLWPLLRDLERIASCLPGGTITERVDALTYRGTITIKVGPVTVSYAGIAKVLEMDQESGRMVLRCEGRETRGPGSASADIAIQLAADQDGSTGTIRSDVAVTGRVAQFGRSMMAEVGDRLLTQFARCVEARMAEPSPAPGDEVAPTSSGAAPIPAATAPPEQVNVLRLLLSIAWDRIRFWRRR